VLRDDVEHDAPPGNTAADGGSSSTTLQGAGFWLLRIVLPVRGGRWLTGTLIFAVLLLVFLLVNGIEGGAGRMSVGVTLFFCILLAYIVPVHHLIMERSLNALTQLVGSFPDRADDIALCRRQILYKPGLRVAAAIGAGLVAGVAHNALLFADGQLTDTLSNAASMLSMSITLLTWVIMTAVIASLLENAVRFARLGARVHVDVLSIRALTPFGSIAVSSTLAMIGAQAAFPTMFLDDDVHWVTFVPGLIATAIPMVALLVLPIWPVHGRMLRSKRDALNRVNRDIARLTREPPTAGNAYAELEPLLVYRREVAGASEWPFDTSVVSRLGLYLIIPPLTWVGAALIEILVETAI
jgi:hypothetical protein